MQNLLVKQSTKLLLTALTIIMVSCSGSGTTETFSYDLNPQFNRAEMEYFGKYYSGTNSHVLTASFYTEKLILDKDGMLTGTGQHLKIVDIFVPVTDTTLVSGTYTAAVTGAPLTFYTKVQKSTDKNKYPFATLKYFETIAGKSTEKQVEGGQFTVSKSGSKYLINFDLVLSDNSTVKGSFTGEITLKK